MLDTNYAQWLHEVTTGCYEKVPDLFISTEMEPRILALYNSGTSVSDAVNTLKEDFEKQSKA